MSPLSSAGTPSASAEAAAGATTACYGGLLALSRLGDVAPADTCWFCVASAASTDGPVSATAAATLASSASSGGPGVAPALVDWQVVASPPAGTGSPAPPCSYAVPKADGRDSIKAAVSDAAELSSLAAGACTSTPPVPAGLSIAAVSAGTSFPP